jgi:hypothetical protein
MTLWKPSARTIRVSVLLSLFGYLSIAPNACINATRFSDVTLVRPVHAQAPGPKYTYTVIADASHCINVGNPVLNNAGQVAFATSKCTGPIEGPLVQRGDGGPLTEIYSFKPTSTFSLPEFTISINDSGTVAFPGWTPFDSPTRYAILAGDGGPVNTIADSGVHTQFKAMLRPSINNVGAVAFMAATTVNSYDTVVVASAGSFSTIAGPGSATSSIGGLLSALEPSLNNHGVVSFNGQGLLNFGVFKSNGGPLTTISVNNPGFSAINDSGRVVFPTSGLVYGVQLGDGGPLTTVASYPTYVSFGGEASVNNADVVAFWAQLPSGLLGVFVGPDPATDTVIKAGDVLPGCGTVTGVGAGKEAINDAGQVAFVARCNHGGTIAGLIVRADPISIPTTTTLGASPSPGAVGQPVTLSATVAATSGVASGPVDFYDGATLLGTSTLLSGVASFQTAALTLGSHTLSATFRGSTGFLPSRSPTVPFVVTLVPPVQPPIELRASAINGNLVTLRWTTSSIGPTPTNFVIEGGVAPGEVRGSVVTNSPFPIAPIAAPTGAFYVRVYAIAGSERSGPSNEIRIFVNVPTSPSAPANLTALVNGSSLALTWRPTFLGVAPTGYILNVTGGVNTSLPIGQGHSFSFNGVPAGTYTLSVSATNAGVTSAPSNAVTVTLPGSCTGAPLTPASFLAHRVGNTVHVVWDPPASGPAPTSYVLNVTGAFVSSFTTTGLSLSGTAGPGSYGLSVLAGNPCGSSAPTSVQTIAVP